MDSGSIKSSVDPWAVKNQSIACDSGVVYPFEKEERSYEVIIHIINIHTHVIHFNRYGMSEVGRVGTVDLIIEVLREHERTFDSLFNHLDSSIDRMDMQRIEAKLKTEKEENEKIEALVFRIAELEEQIKRYKERIGGLETQTMRIKNISHK
jgi:hypothetical protein